MKKLKEMFCNHMKDIKILNLLFILIAGTINALGVTLFLFPVKLYDSGVSGCLCDSIASRQCKSCSFNEGGYKTICNRE